MLRCAGWLLLLVPATLLADWPQWRGPGRNGSAADSPRLLEKLPEQGLKPVWLNKQAVAGLEGWSSPIVADGKVFLYGRGKTKNKLEERLFCVDAASGELLWTSTRASESTNLPPSCTPTVADGRVYVMGAKLAARCLDARTGDEVWIHEFSGDLKEQGWQSSPVVADGAVVVVAGRLCGLDARSGDVLWQGKDAIAESMHGSPAVVAAADGPLVVAPIGQGEMICVEPRSGREHWRVKTEAVHSTPVVQGDRIVTLGHSRKGGLRCYRVSSGGAEELWTYQSIADQGSCPVIVGDHVYAQGGRQLACVSLADGKPAWTAELDMKDPRYTSLVAADGHVIYALESILAFAADPAEHRLLYKGLIDRDGLVAEEPAMRKLLRLDQFPISSEGQKEAEKLWRERVADAGPVHCTSPALSEGRLYVRLKQGLACYDLRR